MFGKDTGFTSLQNANQCPLSAEDTKRVPVKSIIAKLPWSPGAQNRSYSAWCRGSAQTSVILSLCLHYLSLFHLPCSLTDSTLWYHSRGAVGRYLKGSGLTDLTRNSSQALIPGLWGQRGSCDLLSLTSCRERVTGLPSLDPYLKCSIEYRKHALLA